MHVCVVVAKLEEVNRMKARLEAKLRAKQLRKSAKGIEAHGTLEASDGTIVSGDTATPTRSVVKCDPLIIPTPEAGSNGGPPSESPSDMTTPTTSTTPLISPGFRTPSPPLHSRFMSPPSGASSRKRQHSPSPLPKASSTSTQRFGSLTPTPKRYLRFPTEGANTPEKASSFHDKMKQELKASKTWTEETYDELLDDELDGASLDALLSDDFDQVGTKDVKEIATVESSTDLSTTETGGRGTTNHSLTEIVENQRRKREAEIAALKAPKATFYTVAADLEPLSTSESTRLRHTSDFDPLTGLRIR